MARSNSKRKNVVLLTYGPACVWCGCELQNNSATIDHIRCVDEGGSNWIGNLLPSCGSCNAERNNLSVENWLSVCLRRKMDVNIKLVEEAIERARNNPLAENQNYCRHRLLEQTARKHSWHLGQSMRSLLQLDYMH